MGFRLCPSTKSFANLADSKTLVAVELPETTERATSFPESMLKFANLTQIPTTKIDLGHIPCCPFKMYS
jgi:hypothetical protein